jgi:hypothetical protein
LLEAPESQLICAAADRVILLVDGVHTPSGDLSAAAGVLLSAKAQVAGIVMDRTMGQLASRQPTPAAVDAAPQVHVPAPRADVTVGAEPPSDSPNGQSTPHPRVGAAAGAERPCDPPAGRPTPYPRNGLVGAISSIKSNGSKDGT